MPIIFESNYNRLFHSFMYMVVYFFGIIVSFLQIDEMVTYDEEEQDFIFNVSVKVSTENCLLVLPKV